MIARSDPRFRRGGLSLLAGVTLLVLGPGAFAAEVELHGFAQGDYSSRVTGLASPSGSDFILAEERLQLALTGTAPSGRAGFSAKTDLIHDSVSGQSDVEIREAYLDLSAGPFEARVGRQIVTWGTGDLLFVNDIFPKDWAALFAGRPLEYLKVATDALKLDAYGAGIEFETVVSPFFEADRLPSPDRFLIRDPFSGFPELTVQEPRASVDHAEIAFKASRTWVGWEWALYVDRGFYRAPALDSYTAATPVLRFPRRHVYGASVHGAGLDGVLNFEAGYYDSREDPEGDVAFLPNSQALYLAGYKRQMGRNLTLGLQVYGERMLQYDSYRSTLPDNAPAAARSRTLLATRLTWFSNYQTWRLSFFGYGSPSDEDFYLIPEVWHSLADGVWAAVGANVFGGDEGTFFGQLDRNDNAYAAIRYEF